MSEKTEIKQKYDIRAGEIEREWNQLKDFHKNVSPVLSYFRMRKIEAARRLGNFEKGSRILDVGSNMGQYTTLLAEMGFQMTGIDLSDKAIEMGKKIAQASGLNIEYFQSDTENLNLFGDEAFDGVVSFSTLRYVPNLKKALNEIYRVTKKNGAVVLDFPNKFCPWFTLLKNKFGVENHIYDHFFSVRELSSLFREVGFVNIECRKIMFTHYTFSPKFLTFYKAIDSVFERMPLFKETAAIIVCKGVKP